MKYEPIDEFYFVPTADDLSVHRRIWESFYRVAMPVLECFTGDLFYDAIILSHMTLRSNLVWYYCVGKNGTHLIFQSTEEEEDLMERMKFLERQHVFRCQIEQKEDRVQPLYQPQIKGVYRYTMEKLLEG